MNRRDFHTRATFPLIETIKGEDFVSKKVPPRIEMMLLLAKKVVMERRGRS